MQNRKSKTPLLKVCCSETDETTSKWDQKCQAVILNAIYLTVQIKIVTFWNTFG